MFSAFRALELEQLRGCALSSSARQVALNFEIIVSSMADPLQSHRMVNMVNDHSVNIRGGVAPALTRQKVHAEHFGYPS
jgi:hypothetical protein